MDIKTYGKRKLIESFHLVCDAHALNDKKVCDVICKRLS